MVLAEPVPVLDPHRLDRERAARTDHDSPLLGLDPDHIERFGLAADVDPAPLANGEMDDSAVVAERGSVNIDDLARNVGFGPEPFHQTGIIAVGHEADVLAVGLGRDIEPDLGRDSPHFGLGQSADREAQEIELLAGRAVEEIALVAALVGALVELDPAVIDQSPDIMAGRQAIGAKLARERDQVDELDALVARRARDRCPAAGIFVEEAVDHPFAEAGFIIEHIMGDSEPVGDRLGVVNVLPRAARAGPPDRFAMIVELERHSNDLGAALCSKRGRDRAVDPARHGDDDSGVTGTAAEVEIDIHRSCSALFTRISLLAARAGSRNRSGVVLWRDSKAIFSPPPASRSKSTSFWPCLTRANRQHRRSAAMPALVICRRARAGAKRSSNWAAPLPTTYQR